LSVQNRMKSIDLGKADDPITKRSPPTEPPLQGYLESPREQDDPGSVVGYALETGKWAISGVSTAVSSVMNYFSWGSSPITMEPHKEFKEFAEFTVIQINWYWRQQKRILRFLKDRFSRLNPFTNELRVTHKYSTIKSISVTGKTFMTINFNDESLTEYYQTVDTDQIVQIITSKITIPVTFLKE